MVVYIRKSKYPTEVSLNKYAIQVASHLLGEETVLYNHLKEIPSLSQDDILVDYITETRAVLDMMGVDVPVIDYPKELEPFYGRNIWEGRIGEIVNEPKNWGVFIKPKAGSKIFTGRVVNGTKDLVGIGLPFDYPIWISESIDLVAEWRCFVLNGVVIDVRPYIGDYHYHYDAQVIDEAVATWSDAPSAYSLDIGVTKEGKTLIVEVNDAYALGNYGLSPLKAFALHKTRWQEMIKDYFASQNQFIMPKDKLEQSLF